MFAKKQIPNRNSQNLPCPVCDSNARYFGEHSEATLMQCTKCGHRFSLLKGEPESYSADYFEEAHKNWFNHPNTLLFRKITNELKDLPRGARVLDVGCGKGDFLKFLRQQRPDLELFGLDLSPNEDVEGITFFQQEIEKFQPEERFDAVVSMAVVEHIDNIQAFAASLNNLVTSHGLVAVMTLDDESLLYMVGRLLNKLGISIIFNRIYQAHHLHHFNRNSLRILFEGEGMTEAEYYGHNAPLAAIDIPAKGPIQHVLRVGVWGVFFLGKICGRPYLQTLFLHSRSD